MMENRSFDHFLGWLPGADGRQAGLTYTRPAGRAAPHPPPAPTTRAAATPTPTTPTRAAASSTTAAAATAGCARASNDAVRDRLLQAGATSAFSARRRRTGRRSTATSPRSWPRPTPTASTSTPRRPTACTTRSTSSTLPTIWDRLADAGVTRPLLLQRRAVPRAVGREVPRHQPPVSPTFLADCAGRHAARGVASSTRGSSDEGAGHLRPTTTRTPTSAPARRSSTRSTTR